MWGVLTTGGDWNGPGRRREGGIDTGGVFLFGSMSAFPAAKIPFPVPSVPFRVAPISSFYKTELEGLRSNSQP